MEFTRKRIRGKRQESYREWWDESGNYRITWRNEFCGIALEPRFYAMVKVVLAEGQPYIDFVGRRSPYKTFKAAVQAAEKHQKTWLKLLEIATSERKGRADRIRDLDERARGGTDDEKFRILMNQPAWLVGKLPNHTLQMLWPGAASEPNCIDSTPSPFEDSATLSIPQ